MPIVNWRGDSLIWIFGGVMVNQKNPPRLFGGAADYGVSCVERLADYSADKPLTSLSGVTFSTLA